MNFNETVAAAELLSLCYLSSFHIIGEMFRRNELFVDSVAN